jgi:hypothetical protein
MRPHQISSYLSINAGRSTMSDTRTGHHYGAEWYEIRIKGHLDSRWGAWFDGLSLQNDSDGTTVIAGLIADQAALHGLLQRVRDIGLPLVSVTSVIPDAVPPSSPADPTTQYKSTNTRRLT